MKKILSIFTCLFLVVMLSACEQEEVKTPDDEKLTLVEYTNIEVADLNEYGIKSNIEDEVFVYANVKEINEAIENGDNTIIFFTRVGCAWCLEATPILFDTAKELGVKIYMVKPYEVADWDNYNDYEQQSNKLQEFLLGDDEFYIPNLFVVTNGEVTGNHYGTIEGHNAHESKLDEDGIKELSDIYNGMLEQFK